jgi:GAF domain
MFMPLRAAIGMSRSMSGGVSSGGGTTRSIEAGTGLIGTAASRRRVVATANLDRARAMALAATGHDGAGKRELPGLPGARSAAAVPLVVGKDVLGVLYLESNSAYIVKGAPGRILWSKLKAHADSGRTQFSNRELRLDESLGLPAGSDNLEARLLVLRRRLADLDCGVTLERVGRGRLELRLERPAELTEVPTRLLERS